MSESFRVTWVDGPSQVHVNPFPSPSGWHKARLSWPGDLWTDYCQLYITIDEETGEFYRFQIERTGEHRWVAHVVHDLENGGDGGRYYTRDHGFFTRSQARIWCESLLLADDCPPMYGEIT
jgi:hypothetical protein